MTIDAVEMEECLHFLKYFARSHDVLPLVYQLPILYQLATNDNYKLPWRQTPKFQKDPVSTPCAVDLGRLILFEM